MFADLHTHTTASDGRLSPAALVRQAAAAGLSQIAITDHDTVDGLLALAGQNLPPDIEIIPGIEFSTDVGEHEVHILGYCFDIHNPALRQQLTTLVQHRTDRVHSILDKLKTLGYPLDYHQVEKNAPQATALGRPHIARALVEQGYLSTVAEAFDQLLGTSAPAYVPHYKLTPAQVIKLIQEAGGAAVLAHPGQIGSWELVNHIISLGLNGLEVYHPRHSEADRQKLEQLARLHHLVITGGSDYHAIPGRYPEQLGIFTVPSSLIRRLQECLPKK